MKEYRFHQPGVLAEYDTASAITPEFWDANWGSKARIESSLEKARGGYLGGMGFLAARLRGHRSVLEAGCGRSQIVRALAARGFDVTGVDFCDDTLAVARAVAPELKLVTGDVRRLPFGEGSFECYLSLGVIEHFVDTEDVEAIFREAKRVTTRLMFFSVPHLSPTLERRVMPHVTSTPTGEFYQYYFSKSRFVELLERHGLSPRHFSYYASAVGLRRNVRLAERTLARSKCARYLIKRSEPFINRMCGRAVGHMIGAWCTRAT